MVNLNNLKWEGNSRAMVDGILRAVPSLFRGKVLKSIRGMGFEKQHNSCNRRLGI